jgi:hypothetical protein
MERLLRWLVLPVFAFGAYLWFLIFRGCGIL